MLLFYMRSFSGEDAIKAIMEKQKAYVAPVKSVKTVDNELKQKMLQQYGEISDGEEYLFCIELFSLFHFKLCRNC